MNCGLCGLNESASIDQKVPGRIIRVHNLENVSLFHSLGGVFNREKKHKKNGWAVDGRCGSSSLTRRNQPARGNKTPGVFVIHQEHAVLCHSSWLPAKSKATHCTAAKRQRQLPLCSVRAVRGGVGGYADH